MMPFAYLKILQWLFIIENVKVNACCTSPRLPSDCPPIHITALTLHAVGHLTTWDIRAVPCCVIVDAINTCCFRCLRPPCLYLPVCFLIPDSTHVTSSINLSQTSSHPSSPSQLCPLGVLTELSYLTAASSLGCA